MTTSTVATAHTTKVQNPRLRLLNKLREGAFPLMTFMAIPSVRMAQIVALTGLDVSSLASLFVLQMLPALRAPRSALVFPTLTPQAVIIDCEHGHIGDDSMHNAVAAISALGVSPVIRVRGPAPDILKRALDTGVQ